MQKMRQVAGWISAGTWFGDGDEVPVWVQ